MNQPFRLAGSALDGLDRARVLHFTFAGRPYPGYSGDTLASALLANGVRVIGRSFKYHRPRGVMGYGSEESSALLKVTRADGSEPNTRPTTTTLVEGLQAEPQHCWPGLKCDIGVVNGLLGRFIPAGFYYKTFMQPVRAWRFYESVIRRAAGLGRVPDQPDTVRHDKRFAHVEVLVVGAGPAGLAAALMAGRSGVRVILADEGIEPGGRLLHEPHVIDDEPASGWVRGTLAELDALTNVRVLRAATVAGVYDHGFLTIVERLRELNPLAAVGQRLWKVRAAQVVFATGAIERPLIFPNNDRPGVMLASATVGYAYRYGVACGRRAVLATNNDSAYVAALQLHARGIAVEAIVDSRASGSRVWHERVHGAGMAVFPGHAVARVRGREAVTGVELCRLGGDDPPVRNGDGPRITCDLVGFSGGWSPTVQLHAQMGGKLQFDKGLGGFLPTAVNGGYRSAGACRGAMTLAGCLMDGFVAGAEAVRALGRKSAPVPATLRTGIEADARCGGTWFPPGKASGPSFVDFQNDVTVADIELAAREGYDAVEHLKRYTTLGMGTDQGKLGNVNGIGILARSRGLPVSEVGTTKFRPPYAPISFGVVAGRDTGALGRPLRRGPLDAWHESNGGGFVLSGLWRRPRYYARPGERGPDAVKREARHVRNAVGMVDVSTLGKLDIQGPDAAELLNRLFVNRWTSLAVGRARYWLALRDDGVVLDDGVGTRLDERHFFVTTSTGHIDAMHERIEFHLQTAWRDIQVFVTPVSEQWFAAAIAGPEARKVVAALTDDIDVSAEAFPHMAVRAGTVAGLPSRVIRSSFSGELAYEIYIPADQAGIFWRRALEAGSPHGMCVYGAEAMSVLRIEKGHVVIGREADGRATPDDLGLDRLVDYSKSAPGVRSLALPGMRGTGNRRQLVGVIAVDPSDPLPAGAHIVAQDGSGSEPVSLGNVTSLAYSPNLERHLALALVTGGRARIGETFDACSPLTDESVSVRLVDPVFYDPEGVRVRG